MDFPGSSNSRTLLLVIAAISTLMIFMTTERCFSDADVRNAITMVQTLRAHPQAPTLPEAMVARHPGIEPGQIRFTGEITDAWYGFVRVRAALGASDAPIVYLFDVNLSGQRLHPANDEARALMEELRASAADASAAADGRDSPR